MIFLTKRIRVGLAFSVLEEFAKNQKILDVGAGDEYFSSMAKKRGIDIQPLEIEKGQNFFETKKSDATTIIALALLWHIDNQRFFEHAKGIGIQTIITIQGKPWMEPITKLYGHNHKHIVLPLNQIDGLAKNNGYDLVKRQSKWLWDVSVYQSR